MFGLEELLYSHLLRHVGIRGQMPDFKGSLHQKLRAMGSPHLQRWHRTFIAVAEQANDITVSSNLNADGQIIVARNLTINSGSTVTMGKDRFSKIITADTLTVNGSLVVPAGGNNGANTGTFEYDDAGTLRTTDHSGGAGGEGGNGLFIFARKIQGSGIISANGGTGGTGGDASDTGAAHKSGATGLNGFMPFVARLPQGGEGGYYRESDYASNSYKYGGAGGSEDDVLSILLSPFILSPLENGTLPEIYAGGGGEGAKWDDYDYGDSNDYHAGGGCGGGSWTAKGGDSLPGEALNLDFRYPSGGGGGGGGGLIVAVAHEGIETINLHAKGGRGGDGGDMNWETEGSSTYEQYEAGSGGGGGYVLQVTPLTTANVDVSGGPIGTRNGTGLDSFPQPGQTGASKHIAEVW